MLNTRTIIDGKEYAMNYADHNNKQISAVCGNCLDRVRKVLLVTQPNTKSRHVYTNSQLILLYR